MTSSTHSSDKHSPHTSPRFSRRSTTPSLMAVQNDLYAGHIPTLSLAAQQQQQQQQASATANYISAASVLTGVSGGGGHQPSPSAPPMNVVNGSNQHQQQQLITTTITSSSSNVVMPSQKSTNRMSAPLMGTNAVIVGGYGSKISSKTDSTNDNSSSSYAILQNLQESPGIISKEAQKREANSAAIASATSTVSTPSSSSVAPPLPPRKSSPGAENSITSPTNGHANNGGVGGGAVQKISLPQTSKSVDNIAATLGDICVPKTTAPPIPPHNTTSSHVDTLVEELRTQRITNTVVAVTTSNNTTASSNNTSNVTTLLDDDIVGPAETIMGVIDTRPLEVRSAAAAASANYTQLQLCTTTTTTSSSMMVVVNSSNCNARNDSKVANNERSSSATISETPKLATNQHQHQQQHQHHHQHQYQHQHQQPSQPLLYENISINQKVGDCTVPYENINLEYIARLMNEGYSKENAITALGISRNNIEMACDILREFVAKNSV